MKTERKLENKGIEISNLKRDLAYWRDSAKEGRTKLIANRMKAECEVEYQSNTFGKYIVEVNEGTYLVECEHDAYEYWKKHGLFPTTTIFTCTENAFNATRYKEWKEAKKRAEKCGGRVLQHKPNLEVVE
ncbi:hypothetical protein FH136_10050 [Staphylococcus hominis]|uniref:hypothetical protein n=1 Tax=Staphylococcus hominis TaxID=1290 RepID=UPI00114D47E4|nr:hypothetical protein [Staphylococcus hominis]MCI2923914.1 hypothetical protein [Staphylococcus hominis]MDS3912825.1 hypothetical protein [Staphylococcus hominis]